MPPKYRLINMKCNYCKLPPAIAGYMERISRGSKNPGLIYACTACKWLHGHYANQNKQVLNKINTRLKRLGRPQLTMQDSGRLAYLRYKAPARYRISTDTILNRKYKSLELARVAVDRMPAGDRKGRCIVPCGEKWRII